MRLLCTFVPQAWINDNAVTVDHMEGREYQWIVNLPGRDVPPEPHSYETDALREGTGAPLWVQDWSGPFEVEYEVLPHGGVAQDGGGERRIADAIKDDETGALLAWAFPAWPASVATVMDAVEGDDDGCSPWMWLRLANGDLMLGVFPRGETYFAVEDDTGRDVTYPREGRA